MGSDNLLHAMSKGSRLVTVCGSNHWSWATSIKDFAMANHLWNVGEAGQLDKCPECLSMLVEKEKQDE